MKDEYDWEYRPEPLSGLRSVLGAFDWEQVRAEVEQECQARIAVTGLRGAGKSSLLNRLRGWEISPVGMNGNDGAMTCEDLGLFVLVDLPANIAAPGGSLLDDLPGSGEQAAWSVLADSDLILFLLDGEALWHADNDSGEDTGRTSQMAIHVRAAEYQWFCRIRSLGRPLLVGLNKTERLDGQMDTVRAELERRLAVPVLPLSVHGGLGVEAALLPRLLEACPRLAVPLGRDLPAVRHRAANRLIRQATLLSAVTGLEPVPLLDIPLQLAAQMRMLCRLAALHARLEAGDGSRELLAAVAGGLGLRLAAQEAAKLVPVLGWAVSGLLSGLTTWLLGQAAVAYLDGSLEKRVPALMNWKTAGRRNLRIGEVWRLRLPFSRKRQCSRALPPAGTFRRSTSRCGRIRQDGHNLWSKLRFQRIRGQGTRQDDPQEEYEWTCDGG
jgi:uncharacterized protein (DUF697 family)